MLDKKEAKKPRRLISIAKGAKSKTTKETATDQTDQNKGKRGKAFQSGKYLAPNSDLQDLSQQVDEKLRNSRSSGMNEAT